VEPTGSEAAIFRAAEAGTAMPSAAGPEDIADQARAAAAAAAPPVGDLVAGVAEGSVEAEAAAAEVAADGADKADE
jgi:hypothetical protein